MNESATLRFEFVESGGSGPGPAGVPAPGSGNGGGGTVPPANVPEMVPPPAKGPSRGPSGDSSVVAIIKDLLNQSGAKGMLGPLAPAADKAVEVAGKLEKIFDGMNRATRPSNEPIVPPTMPKDAPPGPIDLPIPGLPLAGGSVASVASAAAGAVIGSAAFLGMVAKASNSIAASQSKYSPDVAVATAMADVRDIRRELELGRRFGPDVAAGIDATSRIKDNIIRGSAEEIAAWNRLYVSGVNLVETATAIYAGNSSRRTLQNLAGYAVPGAQFAPGPEQLAWAAKQTDDFTRWITGQKSREELKREPLGTFGEPLKHLPLPAWVTDGGGIPVEVKYNGPVMEAN